MKAKDLVKAIRNHKGKIEVPVLVPEDIRYVIVEKQDVIKHLQEGYNQDENAPWKIVDDGTNNAGVMTLGVNH